MQVTSKSRTRLRIENLVFVALFLTALGMLAWLSTRYHVEQDWTAGGRNTLSEASREVLRRMDGPVRIAVFLTEEAALRRPITDLVDRYRRYKKDLELHFVNPETEPEQVRELGIRAGGELIVGYQGRSERLQQLNEESLTNALQGLSRGGERWVVFLQGHGERNPDGKANFDLADWSRQLGNKGLKVGTINLGSDPAIPDNTAVLVIAGPRTGLLPGEIALVRAYLAKGGNLLWLLDPGPLQGLEALADDLEIEVLDGTVVDPTAVQLFGKAFALGTEYGRHPIVRDMSSLTLFPRAAAIEVTGGAWNSDTLLDSSPTSWLETGDLHGEVSYDPGSDIQGPLILALALTRAVGRAGGEKDRGGPPGSTAATAAEDSTMQRVVVVGDGDFLSNAYLGNGGNLDLGLNIVNWLSHDDRLINIPPRTTPDLHLELSRPVLTVIALLFLVVIPLGLVAAGALVWWRRRKA